MHCKTIQLTRLALPGLSVVRQLAIQAGSDSQPAARKFSGSPWLVQSTCQPPKLLCSAVVELHSITNDILQVPLYDIVSVRVPGAPPRGAAVRGTACAALNPLIVGSAGEVGAPGRIWFISSTSTDVRRQSPVQEGRARTVDQCVQRNARPRNMNKSVKDRVHAFIKCYHSNDAETCQHAVETADEGGLSGLTSCVHLAAAAAVAFKGTI